MLSTFFPRVTASSQFEDFGPDGLMTFQRPGWLSAKTPQYPQWVLVDFRTNREIATIGVLWFGIYNLSLNAGEQRVDAGTASMLLQVSPVLIAVLAAMFLGERFTAQLAAGLALAFSGVVVIGLSTSGGDNTGDLLGVVLCLVPAAAYSISVIVQKPLVAELSAVHVTWLACSIGVVTCLPWAGRLVAEVGDAPLSSTLWLVYLGVFPTAIAFTTYAYALRHMTASALGVTTYLDRKSTRLNSSHVSESRMPSSA